MVPTVARVPEAATKTLPFGAWEIRMVPTERVSLLHVVLLSLGLSLLVGCPSGSDDDDGSDPTLDTSGLAVATYGSAYAGVVGVTDYDGPARYEINVGELPPGLEMNEAGAVTGTPTWAGSWDVEILVTGLDGMDDFAGPATVVVSAAGVADAFWGYEHDQFNNMTERYGMMENIWVRLTGVGVTETSSWTMNPGIYLPGEDGQAENGAGDDERIGDLDFESLSIQVVDTWVPFADFGATHLAELMDEEWVPTEEPNTFPNQGYPSVHLPEGDPPVITAEGVFTGGVDGGEASIRIYHPDYDNVISVQYQVVPPDWCQNGVHVDGGQTPGVCE